MELQWENLDHALVKFDLPAENHTISVVLGRSFLRNWAATRLIRHCHGHYEVHLEWNIHDPDSGSFRIIPPGVWHTGRLRGPDGELQLTSFVFTIQERPARSNEVRNTYGTALESFMQLTAETTVADTFGGSKLIRAIRQEVELRENAYFERIYALFHLLMVELARNLPGFVPEKRKATAYATEDFLPERIDRFLCRNYSDPVCCREQMAKHLNVSERQLSRILEQIYHKSFRQMLMEYRMEFAEGIRVSDGLSAKETAQKVGYTSVRGFRNAYEKYHGKKYQE